MQELSGEALFADILRQSIVGALDSTLGKSIAGRILQYLRLDTMENMTEVSTILHSCCGRSAASWVEVAIIKRLCGQIHLNWEEIYGMSFEESITSAYEALVGAKSLQEKTLVLRP